MPGESVWAAMPEPMTTAASSALPRNSASSLRHRTVSRTWCPVRVLRAVGCAQQQDVDSDEPATHRHRCTGRPRGCSSVAVPGDAGLGRGIGQHGVDLPGRAVGVAHPDLVLDGEAAGRLVLDLGREPVGTQPAGGRGHLFGGLHLDAQVVERTGDALAPGPPSPSGRA